MQREFGTAKSPKGPNPWDLDIPKSWAPCKIALTYPSVSKPKMNSEFVSLNLDWEINSRKKSCEIRVAWKLKLDFKKSSTPIVNISRQTEAQKKTSQVFLLHQLWIVNHYFKTYSNNLSNETETLVYPEKRNFKNSSYWHSNSRFILKTTETPVFIFSLLRFLINF